MQSSLKLGRIAGIQIGLHYTWLFAFALVTWSLAEGYFPSNYRGLGARTYWVLGIVAALALFGSVLLHELSHSFMALARGQGVHSITLFIFGGVSNLQQESRAPKDEFLISIVGPLTSLVLAGFFWLLNFAVPRGWTPLGATLSYLSFINLSLGLFNLLPGFPLDGGRVLRSVVWGVSGSLRRATQVASYVGQAIGFLMIFYGVTQVFSGSFLNGLWIAFIGWFLNGAAESTRQQQVLCEDLSGYKVGELMNPHPAVGPPQLSVQDFVYEHLVREGQRALAVADDGQLRGIVTITDARKVPQERWTTTAVSEIMTPLPVKTVSPTTGLAEALQLLVQGTLNQVPVVDQGRVVGMLTRADVMRFIQVRQNLRRRPVASPPVDTS